MRLKLFLLLQISEEQPGFVAKFLIYDKYGMKINIDITETMVMSRKEEDVY